MYKAVKKLEDRDTRSEGLHNPITVKHLPEQLKNTPLYLEREACTMMRLKACIFITHFCFTT